MLSEPGAQPAPLLPAEFQPGHQSADRFPARTAGHDLKTRLGNLGNVLDEDESQMRVLELDSPVLSNAEFEAMQAYLGESASRARLHLRARGATGLARRWAASARRPRTPCAAAAST